MKKALTKIPASVIILVSLAIVLLLFAAYIKTYNKADDPSFPELTVINDGNTSAENDGKMIFAVGKPVTTKPARDDFSGVTSPGFVLKRTVEMYQYTTDGQSVYTEFRDEQISNIRGSGAEYDNPVFPENLTNAYFFGEATLGGSLRLSESALYTIAEEYCEFRDFKDYEEFDNSFGIRLNSGVYYIGKDPENPEVGDVRITYSYLPSDFEYSFTFIGKQENMTFCAADDEANAIVLHEEITPEQYYYELAGKPDDTARGLITVAVVLLIIAAVVFAVKYIKSNKSGKKRRNYAIIFVLAALLALYPAKLIGSADFGDFGGDSDYGDWGGNDWGSDNDYDWGDDDDYDYNRTTQTTHTNYYYFGYITDEPYGGDEFYYIGDKAQADSPLMLNITINPANDNTDAGVGIFGLAGIADTILLIIRNKGLKKNRKTQKHIAGATATDSSILKSVSDFTAKDENFSESGLCEKLTKIYPELQAGWQAKDISGLRPYMTDAFFAQMDRQLNNYRRFGQTNIVTDIDVRNVQLKGWYESGGNDVMVAELTASIKDYTINDETGEVIKGSKSATKLMRYEWSIVRPTGTKTTGSTTHLEICPNCGAALEINNAGRCKYCDSIIEAQGSDWAINAIKGLAQKTL